MSFENTFMLPGTLTVCSPKSLPALYSAARSEFHRSNDYNGEFMLEVTAVLSHIAQQVYGARFFWSEYNKKLWVKFVASHASGPEGGACMFSCEPNGDYTGQAALVFKGIGLGVPTGQFPYSTWVCNPSDLAKLQAAVVSYSKYSLDLVSKA
jgi:hypothetical protein